MKAETRGMNKKIKKFNPFISSKIGRYDHGMSNPWIRTTFAAKEHPPREKY